MKFVVYEEVFRALPDYCVGVVVAEEIDNTKSNETIKVLYENQMQKTMEILQNVNLKESPALLPYRQAMQAVGINPNKYPSSIEAMLKRVQKGHLLPSINPAVDLSNLVSMKYLLPMGSHDMDALTGNIAVRFSRESDVFLPLGESEEESVEAGDLVYCDEMRIRTRRWIWRQSDVGKITEDTRRIFFPIDGFANSNKEAVLAAAEELEALLKTHFHCETKRGFVDREHPESIL
ncbi:MAG: hypothetical protein GX245_05415 [Eubacteriaceae bacterium]|jgi:DNA/RNA-binding domain of Phe-tRNA-synthetase-like protein|nr:hypothetical protein [Eubacteriaceae bacterium]